MTGYIVRHTRRNNIVLTNMEEGMAGKGQYREESVREKGRQG